VSVDVNTVVVTGAGSGIGLAIARQVVAEGRTVVAVDTDRDALDRLATDSTRVEPVVGDVRDPATLRRARQSAEGHGGLAGWINNAGIVRLAPLHEAEAGDIDAVLDINLKAVVLGCQVALQSFLEHGVAGVIVNISSVHGRFGFPGYGAYDAAKGGVEALTRYVCVEYGHLGIRCNAVAPGVVDTNIVPSTAADLERERAAALALSPMRRMSQPAEIAEVVGFLLSDRATSINGQVLGVDNGMSARVAQFEPHHTVAFR
jgi:NAD(P)-dependent dehydrogenase (short-subunit alcohol dehydrogenase family)